MTAPDIAAAYAMVPAIISDAIGHRRGFSSRTYASARPVTLVPDVERCVPVDRGILRPLPRIPEAPVGLFCVRARVLLDEKIVSVCYWRGMGHSTREHLGNTMR